MCQRKRFLQLKHLSKGTSLRTNAELVFAGSIQEEKTKAVIVTEGGFVKTVSIADVPNFGQEKNRRQGW